MENLYILGTIHGHKNNEKLVSESIDILNPDRIYIEKGQFEDTPYYVTERLNNINLSTLEIISSFFDCYSMKKSKYDNSEFKIARRIANNENIPIEKVDISRKKLINNMFKTKDNIELLNYIKNQSSNIISKNNKVKSIFRRYSLDEDIIEKRNKKIVNNINSMKRVDSSVLITGSAHAKDITMKFNESSSIKSNILWNQFFKNDSYTRKEIKSILKEKTQNNINNKTLNTNSINKQSNQSIRK